MSSCEVEIEIEARRVLSEYKARRFSADRMPYRTRLEQYGVELDAVRCYLNGFMISETVRFLNKERGVSVSSTVVGRLYRELFVNKVYPVKRCSVGV